MSAICDCFKSAPTLASPAGYAPRPSDSSNASGDAEGIASAKKWTVQEKIGVALMILTVVMLALAAVFGAGVFDKMVHISKTNLISGSIAIAAIIPLVAGPLLFCNPCAAKPRQIT